MYIFTQPLHHEQKVTQGSSDLKSEFFSTPEQFDGPRLKNPV